MEKFTISKIEIQNYCRSLLGILNIEFDKTTEINHLFISFSYQKTEDSATKTISKEPFKINEPNIRCLHIPFIFHFQESLTTSVGKC